MYDILAEFFHGNLAWEDLCHPVSKNKSALKLNELEQKIVDTLGMDFLDTYRNTLFARLDREAEENFKSAFRLGAQIARAMEFPEESRPG